VSPVLLRSAFALLWGFGVVRRGPQTAVTGEPSSPRRQNSVTELVGSCQCFRHSSRHTAAQPQ
jgi:hypothetical protein